MDVAPSPEDLLALLLQLASGEAVAPDELARRSSVDVDALPALLPLLADHGVRRLRDGRLRVPGGVELLDVDRITRSVAFRDGREVDVRLRPVTPSTNDDVKALLEGGATAPLAVLAEAQTAGRGRRGRSWASPVAANLYLSLAHRLPEGVESARGISLSVGVGAAEALERACGCEIQLKWPNDVLVGGRKVGGILVELALFGTRAYAIIGIGINVRVPDYAAGTIDQSWADLVRAIGAPVSRNDLAAEMISAQGHVLGHFDEAGFDALLRARWQSRDPYFGRRVQARWAERTVEGTARGIDQRGELIIETASGRERVGAGEVSIRPLEPAA